MRIIYDFLQPDRFRVARGFELEWFFAFVAFTLAHVGGADFLIWHALKA